MTTAWSSISQPSKEGSNASLAFYRGFQLQPEIPRLNSDRRPMKSKFSYIVIINVTDADKRLFLTLKMTTAGLTRVCSDYSVNNPVIRNIYWEIVTILTSCANYVSILLDLTET